MESFDELVATLSNYSNHISSLTPSDLIGEVDHFYIDMQLAEEFSCAVPTVWGGDDSSKSFLVLAIEAPTVLFQSMVSLGSG